MNNNAYKLVIALLVFALAYDVVAHGVNVRTIRRLNEKLMNSHELARYLASKLDEHGIERTEFDKLVMDIYNHQP